MKDFIRIYLSCLILFVPMFLVFAAIMLSLGSYQMDIMGIWCFAAALLLYKPCRLVSDRLWRD